MAEGNLRSNGPFARPRSAVRYGPARRLGAQFRARRPGVSLCSAAFAARQTADGVVAVEVRNHNVTVVFSQAGVSGGVDSGGSNVPPLVRGPLAALAPFRLRRSSFILGSVW
jgi:hypothetical protein